uniref:Pyruvate kinase n=1 Tax=Lygus hesperus TaxID=30085 RepID=A0A0A9WS13_LYGHE
MIKPMVNGFATNMVADVETKMGVKIGTKIGAKMLGTSQPGNYPIQSAATAATVNKDIPPWHKNLIQSSVSGAGVPNNGVSARSPTLLLSQQQQQHRVVPTTTIKPYRMLDDVGM